MKNLIIIQSTSTVSFILEDIPILLTAAKPCSTLLTQPRLNSSLDILIFLPLYWAFNSEPDQGNVGMSAVWATMEEATLSPKAHIALSGGPKKTRFSLCNNSGSFGFSDA